MIKVAVIHGPNLGLLGKREPDVYGAITLDEINQRMLLLAKELGLELRITQSDHEGEIVGAIHACLGWAEAIVINPAAFTHYSIAIRDALQAVRIATVEVHLTNIYAREEFRNHSVISAVVVGCIAGLGLRSYTCALESLIGILRERANGS